MTLQIDSDQLCALVRSGMARTGQNETTVLEAAMRHYLAQLDSTTRKTSTDDMLARCDEALAINSLTHDGVIDVRDEELARI